MDIGKVSRWSGLPASTLRYYEEKGLIRSIGRNGLKRVFSESVIQRLALIALGREAGFSLDEIAAMLAAEANAEASGNAINATYVYDNLTGLKLFGKAAYLVKDASGEVLAFMKKSDSEQHIAQHGGSALLTDAPVAMLD